MRSREGNRVLTVTLRIRGYGKPEQHERECVKALHRMLTLQFGDQYTLKVGQPKSKARADG